MKPSHTANIRTSYLNKQIFHEKNYQLPKESNRWLHLIGGALAALAVAFLSLMILVAFGAIIAIPLIAIQSVSFIAVALEMKDVQGGGKFDWTDIAVTIIGAILILIPICCFLYL